MVEDRRGITLVLGGSGFLGAHVLRAAVAESEARVLREATIGTLNGQRVVEDVISAGRVRPPRAVAIDERMSPPFEDARGLVSGAAIPRVRWCPLDALHAGAARDVCVRLEPARVIVCTALSTIPECEAYPGLARVLNVDLPREIAAWCSENGARFVLVSTDLVFGAVAPPPSGFDEHAESAPISQYGRSKAQGEEAVLDVHARGLVVRLPLLFGDSEGRGLGASDRVIQAVERGEPTAMFGDEWRTPLDVASAAAALVELAHGEQHGILHLAGPERMSRHELALRALVAHGSSRAEAGAKIASTTRRELGLEASRPEDVSLDASRARSFLRTKLAGPSETLTRAAAEHHGKQQR